MSSELSDGVIIQELHSLEEIAEWQAVAGAVWSGDDAHRLQASLLLTLGRYGGLLLGARDAGGSMVGILLGFPGIKDGEAVHCSHMLGIVPEWRNRHLGYRLKCRQRELVLAQGLDRIVWTFDPLQTPNAHLNLGHLGGISYQYHVNLYGAMNDALNCGMESDRLTLTWLIRHPLVEQRLAGQAPPPSATELLAAGTPLLTRTSVARESDSREEYLSLVETRTGHDAAWMLVEVPSNIQSIKRLNIAQAQAWRLGIREILTDLFERGYSLLDLVVEALPGQPRRCYYLVGQHERYVNIGADPLDSV